MSTHIDIKTEVIHRYVYELRFEFGQVYCDRAGRIAKEILSRSEFEGWESELINFDFCRLIHRQANLVFNFGPAKLDLSQAQNADVETLISVGDFGKLAEIATSVVVENLDLEIFPRIGFRVWRLYGTSDRKHSEQLVRDLRLFSLDLTLSSSLGEVYDISHRLIVDRPNHLLRIAVTPFEQPVNLPPNLIQAAKAKAKNHDKRQRSVMLDKMKADRTIKYYPQFGVLLDLDAYIEDPPYPDDLTVSDFIMNTFEDFEKIKKTVLTGPKDSR